MITSRGCNTQPRAELFNTLSMTVSRTCVGVASSSSSSTALSGDVSEGEGRVEAS